jgi:putative phage-type endonuclease
MTRPIPGPKAYTDAWYALRYFDECRKIPVTIGASEAAAAIGLSDYETPLHIYLRKRKLLSDKEETERMRMGKRLEPIILDEYGHQTGFKVQPTSQLLHWAEDPCISATPDADVFEASGVKFVVDAKSSTVRMSGKWGEEHSDEIPTDYLIQGQQQMLVADVDRCDFAVLMDGVVRRYTVRRNDRLIKSMVAGLKELIERIVEGEPPEANWEHSKTPELIKNLYGVDANKAIVLDLDTHITWEEYRSVASMITALEKKKKELQARVLAVMGDAATARFPDDDSVYLQRSIVEVAAREAAPYSYTLLTQKKVKT